MLRNVALLAGVPDPGPFEAPSETSDDTLADHQLVAVYGTLKREKSNHALMTLCGLEFVQEDVTLEASYLMVGGGGFPYVHKGGTEKIAVELFRFSQLDEISRLDSLEGHPNWYRREEIEFESGATAWMYMREAFEDGRSAENVNRTRVTFSDGIAKWI